MKTLTPLLAAAFGVAAILLVGCSNMANSDTRGAALNDPGVVRSESSGSIAASPQNPQ